MNSNSAGKQSRAATVKIILEHFNGEVPSIINSINLQDILDDGSDYNRSVANIFASSPGVCRYERIEDKLAEVYLSDPRTNPKASLKGRLGFTATFFLSRTGNLAISCTCHEQLRSVCSHILAAAMVLQEIKEAGDPAALVAEQLGNWRSSLHRLIEAKPTTTRKSSSAVPPAILFFSLIKNFGNYEVHPFIIRDVTIPPGLENEPDQLGIFVEGLSSEPDFLQRVKEVKAADIPKLQLVNRTNLSTMLIKAALDQTLLYRSYYSPPPVYFWEGLSNELVYLGGPSRPLGPRLQVMVGTAPVSMSIEHTDVGLELKITADLPQGKVELTNRDLQSIHETGHWFCYQSTLFRMNIDSQAFGNLHQSGTVRIPAAGISEFYERYLPELTRQLPYALDAGKFLDLPRTTPVPRLYLTEQNQELRVSIRFGYGDFELRGTRKVPPYSYSYDPQLKLTRRIERDVAVELQWFGKLDDSQTGVKSGSRRDQTEPDTFLLRKGVHPFDFLTRHLPGLVEAGFEVFGEAELKSRINRAKPTISFQVASGIDWFDLKAVIEWGDQQVPLESLRRALRRDERFIKLADGSIGEIPPEWLEKYRHIFGLSEPSEDGYRISRHHLALLDDLCNDGEIIETDRQFETARNLLRIFEGIATREIPRSFRGELRPYQKAGFDWLHFLRQSGFGGCLADDMGTGKTIQTLSFLLSLKEEWEERNSSKKRKEPPLVNLLVVPRSLVTNWIREAERFTPDLRILDFAHVLRSATVKEFNNYDLVITTYGILIREVERMRDFQFDTAILDEAQAIKNPVSESAKAARAINSRHRLTLTGTPVENSTLELWSQFAFLNPGLLGSAEYFREQFISPIERHSDEATTRTLKRLIYPFILRRTKDQVISDLPPRTEKILWGEMEQEQRMVYNETREHYRQLLLKLIEEKGVRQARFRILEGLLRLRQICNHPKLIRSNYEGGSAKMESLLETIETARAEGHKILVFSQFVKMLRLIEKELKKRKIDYAYLDGATTNRQEKVDIFQRDESIGIFLISLKAGGVGLNLTAADYVIHVDPWWNPAVEMQASDRAHRIGQDKPVFIYKLMIKDSVEEKILQLQEKKRSLVTQLITTEAGFFKSLTTEDIEGLFT
ncbi:MAG: DEAD/DEAH box helicase [Acidobacteriota bacterium]